SDKYPLEAVVWSPDGRRLAALEPGLVRVWDLPSRWLQPGAVQAAGAWSPDARHFVFGASPYLLRVGDTGSDEVQTFADHTGGPVGALAWSRDGRWLASAAADHTVRVWDPSSGAERLVLRGHPGPVTQVWWGEEDRCLLTLCGPSQPERQTLLRVWDAA